MTPDQLLSITAHNSSFSRQTPGLQLAVDSTSLGAFKTCPRFYELSILRGIQPRQTSVHLTFGLHLHRARETYEHAIAKGASHDDALDTALAEAMANTWNKALNRPWISDPKVKTRATLIRSIVWYLDTFGRDDPLRTVVLRNNKPAVELSFRFDSGYKTQQAGEQILLCGHLDRIASLNGEFYIPDIKTTLHTLSPDWFKSWSPGNQFSIYTLAGKVAFDFEVKGVIVDAIQIGVAFSRFQRGPVPPPQSVLHEWLSGAGWWFRLMESCARAGYWPQNDKACDMYGGCQFRGICSLPPSSREHWIKSDFVTRVWDPLQVRGDV